MIWNIRWSWSRAALVLFAIICFLGIGRSALYHNERHQGCYPVFAEAGRSWLHGQDLYDPTHPQSPIGFRYSPLIAAFLAPIGAMPDPVGNGVLRAISLVALLASGFWWARTGLPGQWTDDARAGLGIAIVFLSLGPLMDVQFNVLTLACMLVAVTAAAGNRWAWSGLAAALAICMKLYPVALALVLCLLYPKKFAGWFVAMMAVCLALPFLFQEPHYVGRQYVDWVELSRNVQKVPAPEYKYRDFSTVCRIWFSPLPRATFETIQIGAAAAVAGLSLLALRTVPESRRVLNIALLLCSGWMLVFGPATEGTTYVLLAPTAAWAAIDAWRSRAPLWYRLPVTLACLPLLASQLQKITPFPPSMEAWAGQPIGGLVLMTTVATTCIFGQPAATTVSAAPSEEMSPRAPVAA